MTLPTEFRDPHVWAEEPTSRDMHDPDRDAPTKRKPVEIPLKAWCMSMAHMEGISVNSIHMRISRGKYSWLNLRRVNKRVVFVVV